MRLLPILIAFLLPCFGLAAVTIRPGQSITVEPDTRPTVVSCAPLKAGEVASSKGTSGSARPSPGLSAASATDSSGAFCYCRQRLVGSTADFNLTKVSIGEGSARSETALKSYPTSAACDQAIASYAACR